MKRALASASLITACLLYVTVLAGCASIPPKERARVRQELDEDAEQIIADLKERSPEFAEQLERSIGYFAGTLATVKVPVVGHGSGLGIVMDRESGRYTYVNMDQFELGVGLGAESAQGAVLFYEREFFDSVMRSRWITELGSSVTAGEQTASAIVPIEPYSVHILESEGLLTLASSRLGRISVNRDLTETGVSEIGIPNRSGSRDPDEAPPVWDRSLPFLAQKVIDKGYDLPLPFGGSLIYNWTDQQQNIDNLRVGVPGSGKIPIESVTFNEVRSESQTIQAKLDAWLFPFLNVFGLLGYVDGKAPTTFTIDGDTLLEDLGVECGTFPPDPLCLIQGRSVTVPLEVEYEGFSYGFGTILAGGWKKWFGVLPVSFTYADMEGRESEGFTFNLSPRVGRIVPLGRRGTLALFGGANFLKTELEVEGSYTFNEVDATVDYKIDQSNKDPWNALVGFNWNFSRRASWSLEYGGFFGSRENVTSSLSWRF